MNFNVAVLIISFYIWKVCHVETTLKNEDKIIESNLQSNLNNEANDPIANLNIIRNSLKLHRYLENNLKLKPELEIDVVNEILRKIQSIRGEKLNRLNNKINEIKSRNDFKGNFKLEMAITNLEMFVDTIKSEYKPKEIHQIHRIGH